MKKFCVITMLFYIILLNTGCNSKEGPTSLETYPPIPTEETALVETHPPIPYVLTFDSFEQISEMKNIIKCSNEEIKTFLEGRGYSTNGVNSRKDIEKLFEQIGDLHMLHLDERSGYKLTGVSYYSSYGYIMTTYTNNAGFIRFFCYLGEVGDLNDKDSSASEEKELIDTIRVQNNEVGIYKVMDEESIYSLIGRVVTSNSRISILFSKQTGINGVETRVRENLILGSLNKFIQK